MAVCPACGRVNWLWDWCQDMWKKEDGVSAKEALIYEDKNGINIWMYQCDCEAIIGFTAGDPQYGGPVFNHCDWDGTDWESSENRYTYSKK